MTPWTTACQAPLSMGLPRQEYWSGLSSPPPEDLPGPGIKPASPALAGEFSEPPGNHTASMWQRWSLNPETWFLSLGP